MEKSQEMTPDLRKIFQVLEGPVDLVLYEISIDVHQILVDVFKKLGNTGKPPSGLKMRISHINVMALAMSYEIHESS